MKIVKEKTASSTFMLGSDVFPRNARPCFPGPLAVHAHFSGTLSEEQKNIDWCSCGLP